MRDIAVKVFRPARLGAGSTLTRILRSLQFLALGIVNTTHIYRGTHSSVGYKDDI